MLAFGLYSDCEGANTYMIGKTAFILEGAIVLLSKFLQ
jgi:hypothetical protein